MLSSFHPKTMHPNLPHKSSRSILLLLLLFLILPLSLLFLLFRRSPSFLINIPVPTLNCAHLQRLGDEYGGWVFCPPLFSSHLHNAIVYTIGVGRNIQWDLAMIQRYRTQHHGWDPTPTALDFANKTSMPSNFHFHPIGIAARDGNLTLKLPKGKHESYTVMRADREAQEGSIVTLPVLSLESMINSLDHTSLAVLKMDVEGAEFDVIRKWKEDRYIVPAEQLLIEFHERYFHQVESWEHMVPVAIKSLEQLGFDLVSHTKIEYSFAKRELIAMYR